MMHRVVVSVVASDPKEHSLLCRWFGIGRCKGGMDFIKDFATKDAALTGRAALLADLATSPVVVTDSKIEALNG